MYLFIFCHWICYLIINSAVIIWLVSMYWHLLSYCTCMRSLQFYSSEWFSFNHKLVVHLINANTIFQHANVRLTAFPMSEKRSEALHVCHVYDNVFEIGSHAVPKCNNSLSNVSLANHKEQRQPHCSTIWKSVAMNLNHDFCLWSNFECIEDQAYGIFQ